MGRAVYPTSLESHSREEERNHREMDTCTLKGDRNFSSLPEQASGRGGRGRHIMYPFSTSTEPCSVKTAKALIVCLGGVLS